MKQADIYFEEKYGKLYEGPDHGKCTVFEFENEAGKIRHQFIKRDIPKEIIPDENTYYDIVTPYGYGGPLITECKEGSREELVSAFAKEFEKYCADENIVAEFIRFHPIVNNALDFKSVYSPVWDRNTLGTDLSSYEDPIASEFTKHCRKHIRQALNKGVSYRITEKPEDLHDFKKIYYATMDRNEAGDYYYFDDEYFDECIRDFRDNLLLIEAVFEEKTIAAGMYFLYGDLMHIHLSGTLNEYLYLSPAYILRYALATYGKEHGYKMIHHGGGRSNSPEDSLYLFKEQFAQNTKFDFYIARKKWIPEVYSAICRKANVSEDIPYFPAYRSVGH